VLRLELVVVSLVVLLLLLVDLDARQREGEFCMMWRVPETSLKRRSWSSRTDLRNFPTSL
jgi:hypothetical protein